MEAWRYINEMHAVQAFIPLFALCEGVAMGHSLQILIRLWQGTSWLSSTSTNLISDEFMLKVMSCLVVQ
jgi:hypothetical protein